MNISGKMRIYKKEFNGKMSYSTNISRKDEQGNYKNMYVSVQLPKGTEVNDGETIEVKNGFISFYEDKNGLSKIKLVVMNILTYEQEERQAIQNEQTYNYSGDDLPF